MQARGLLMIEHRLIERMINSIEETLKQVETTGEVDPLFVDIAADFIRVYADRTHHGKEEDILFRNLAKKDLSEGDRKVMNELVEEHVFGRKTTGRLVDANTKYRNGDVSALETIADCFRTLVDFYPKHIIKEDRVFFPASREYFSDEEDDAMLQEFWEFDQKMIHEKYRSVVEALEK